MTPQTTKALEQCPSCGQYHLIEYDKLARCLKGHIYCVECAEVVPTLTCPVCEDITYDKHDDE